MSTDTYSHPIFARVYATLARQMERGPVGKVRKRRLNAAEGIVLEIGCGSGENFKHYRDSVERVIATEPDRHMIPHALKLGAEAGIELEIVLAAAEALPFDDASFDTVVSTLVLCSVADPDRALGEIRRVLRADGRLIFFEHVRSESEKLGVWQDRLDRPWQIFGAGCHPNRQTLASIKAAGFELTEIESFDLKGTLPIVKPHIEGEAHPVDLR